MEQGTLKTHKRNSVGNSRAPSDNSILAAGDEPPWSPEEPGIEVNAGDTSALPKLAAS
jgi:hypothetical protein